MSTSIPLTATTQQSLSAARIAQLMDADLQRATKLNVFDRVLDFFRPQSKETALGSCMPCCMTAASASLPASTCWRSWRRPTAARCSP
ncbi:hypothetical protein [Comamonas antarctica]|uniref:hypothetical protein n=1 Tax=Comamonas antarctica TaxID=2743470 RepID=UPI0028F0C2E4|nr:hypothetical protein [Comamonas antarctica]